MFATLRYPIRRRMFTTFLVLPIAYSRDAWMGFTLKTSNDAVLRKEVLSGGYKSEILYLAEF